MSLVNIFGLGGLGEIGKNVYIVEIDQKIFILDCGAKFPPAELYGVDIIQPDFKYIKDNKERVVGIFVTHGHEEHVGAIGQLLDIHDFNVYATSFTKAVIVDILKEANFKYNDEKIIVIEEKTKLIFDGITIDFFQTNNVIPGSLGISIHCKDGSIVYTGNYNFDQNGGNLYRTSFEKLVHIGRGNVLALLTESMGSTFETNRANISLLEHKLHNSFQKAQSRIIVSLFSTNLQRIQLITNIALQHNKKIAILGRKTQRMVNIAMNSGILKIPNDKLVILKNVNETNLNEHDDLVVLVTGERHEPYHMLQKMARQVDPVIRMNNKDTVLFLTRTSTGTEKLAAKTLDLLYRVTNHVEVVDKTLIAPSNASREEIKTLVNLLKPKYVFPVIGEYRHQYQTSEILKSIGYTDKNIIILDNGDIAGIKNKNFTGISGEVSVGEKLIDGKNIENVNDAVMHDRELLADSGVILVLANIDARKKTIITGPKFVSQGFTFPNEKEEFLLKLTNSFTKICTKHFATKMIKWHEFKNDLKNDMNRVIYKQTKSNPIVIPVLVSIEQKKNNKVIKNNNEKKKQNN